MNYQNRSLLSSRVGLIRKTRSLIILVVEVRAIKLEVGGMPSACTLRSKRLGSSKAYIDRNIIDRAL